MNERILKKISEIIIDYAKNHEVIEYNQISKKLGGAISPIRLNEPLGEFHFVVSNMVFHLFLQLL